MEKQCHGMQKRVLCERDHTLTTHAQDHKDRCIEKIGRVLMENMRNTGVDKKLDSSMWMSAIRFIHHRGKKSAQLPLFFFFFFLTHSSFLPSSIMQKHRQQ